MSVRRRRGTGSTAPSRTSRPATSASTGPSRATRSSSGVRGVIEDADALGTHLRCDRLVSTTTGRGEVVIHDVVTNLGPAPVAAPFLYHVNIGAPLWAPGARLVISSAEV